MNIFDDRDKKDTQKQAGVQRASLPSAQKNALPAPLLLTLSWLAVGLPLLWGMGTTLQQAVKFFM